MPILVIGGSERNVGKTAFICALIRALPEFGWTAVKISAHPHRPETVWEETEAGHGTDTARYLAAGARRALLVGASEDAVPVSEMRAKLGTDTNVIFESNRIAVIIQPFVALAIVAPQEGAKPSFRAFLQRADALLMREDRISASSDLPHVPIFRLRDFDHLTPDMIGWLRERFQK